MATTTRATAGMRCVIDAISRDPRVSDDPRRAAFALLILYNHRINELHATIEEMLDDQAWSQDREPYEWLQEVREAL